MSWPCCQCVRRVLIVHFAKPTQSSSSSWSSSRLVHIRVEKLNTRTDCDLKAVNPDPSKCISIAPLRHDLCIYRQQTVAHAHKPDCSAFSSQDQASRVSTCSTLALQYLLQCRLLCSLSIRQSAGLHPVVGAATGEAIAELPCDR